MNLAYFFPNSLPEHGIPGKDLARLMKTLGTGYVCIWNFITFKGI